MYYTTIYTSIKKGPLEKELTIVDPECDAVERNKDHTTKVRREPGGTEAEQLNLVRSWTPDNQ